MVDWTRLKQATLPVDKPTPFYVYREIVVDVASKIIDIVDIADYLYRCIVSDSPHSRIKALICVKHIATKVTPFRVCLRSHMMSTALKTIASSPQALLLISTIASELLVMLQTGDTSIEARNAELEGRIQGVGAYAVAYTPKRSLVFPPVIGEIVEDVQLKGAVKTISDAGKDVLALAGDGLTFLASLIKSESGNDEESRMLLSASTAHHTPWTSLPAPPPASLPLGPTSSASSSSSLEHIYQPKLGQQFTHLFPEPGNTNSLISL